MARVFNFSAGPATLPLDVLKEVQSELIDYTDLGMSVLEISHRSAAYKKIHQESKAQIKELLSIPDDYEVLFLQGGASLQFSMLPMNFLKQKAQYVISGAWAKKAFLEAKKLGRSEIIWNGEKKGFTTLPQKINFAADADYLHLTSNETIEGIQYQNFPDTGQVPLFCDMSSDILSRPLNIETFDLIYAGAQKNIGPSGVTLVILKKSLLEKIPQGLPSMLDYRLQVEKDSTYNTPPVFGVYFIGKVTRWLLEQGGLETVAARNAEKAALLYQVIDESNGYYQGHAAISERSKMNVTFRLPSEELEKTFIEQAEAEGLVGLKGHRSVGGLRASIYNAFPLEGVEKLAQFMRSFKQ